MNKVTIWKRFDDRTRRFEHNHIEDGHVPAQQHEPTPKFENQRKAWTGALWIKRYGRLEGNQVLCDDIEASR